MPFYPQSSDLELRFVIDGKLINAVSCTGYNYPQISTSIDMFIQHAHGGRCVAILYNVKKNEEVKRITKTRRF